MKKYELTEETKEILGQTLHRIRALKNFGDVCVGDLGGWIEREGNLSQEGNAWVYDNAWVYGNARVSGDAWVYGNARVSGDALASGDAYIHSNTAILTIDPIGSRNDTTTFFNRKDGKIGVICGCFRGDIDEFAAAVQKTHGDNQFAVRYKLAIELARAAIETREEDA